MSILFALWDAIPLYWQDQARIWAHEAYWLVQDYWGWL